MWKDILKLKQINIGSTKLRDVNIPEEENDICCQEAKMKYNKVHRPNPTYSHAPYEYVSMADKLDCDDFKRFLGRRPSFRKGGWVKRIFEEWEECENA